MLNVIRKSIEIMQCNEIEIFKLKIIVFYSANRFYYYCHCHGSDGNRDRNSVAGKLA